MGIKDFTARHRSMLRAIADGRGQLNGHANLSVAGLWCDFSAACDLIDNDLIRPAQLTPAGTTTPAVLTRIGVKTLARLTAA